MILQRFKSRTSRSPSLQAGTPSVVGNPPRQIVEIGVGSCPRHSRTGTGKWPDPWSVMRRLMMLCSYEQIQNCIALNIEKEIKQVMLFEPLRSPFDEFRTRISVLDNTVKDSSLRILQYISHSYKIKPDWYKSVHSRHIKRKGEKDSQQYIAKMAIRPRTLVPRGIEPRPVSC